MGDNKASRRGCCIKAPWASGGVLLGRRGCGWQPLYPVPHTAHRGSGRLRFCRPGPRVILRCLADPRRDRVAFVAFGARREGLLQFSKLKIVDALAGESADIWRPSLQRICALSDQGFLAVSVSSWSNPAVFGVLKQNSVRFSSRCARAELGSDSEHSDQYGPVWGTCTAESERV